MIIKSVFENFNVMFYVQLEFHDSLIISSEDVQISSEVLGYGSYSVIYAAQYCEKQCVVKKIRLSAEISYKLLNKELKVLLTLHYSTTRGILHIT